MEISVETVVAGVTLFGAVALWAARLEGRVSGLDKELHAVKVATDVQGRESDRRIDQRFGCLERDVERISRG